MQAKDMRCLDCRHFTFKRAGADFIGLGFGNCEHDARYVMYAAKKDRQCAKHEPIDQKETARREKWLAEKMASSLTPAKESA